MPQGYTAEYEPCEFGVYWKLFHEGRRVNGGISDSEFEAEMTARRHAFQYGKANVVTQDDTDLLMDLWVSRKKVWHGRL